jgi:hypothetical protein
MASGGKNRKSRWPSIQAAFGFKPRKGLERRAGEYAAKRPRSSPPAHASAIFWQRLGRLSGGASFDRKLRISFRDTNNGKRTHGPSFQFDNLPSSATNSLSSLNAIKRQVLDLVPLLVVGNTGEFLAKTIWFPRRFGIETTGFCKKSIPACAGNRGKTITMGGA